MNGLPDDFIAIDTNIFEHLFNPKENIDKHINKILSVLMENKTKLLIDETGGRPSRIRDEYANRLIPRLRKPDIGTSEMSLLDYWVSCAFEEIVVLDNGDDLMTAIRGAMGHSNATDRIFVYVAFKKGRILITNDKKHIIDEGTRKNVRRKRLLKETRQCRKRTIRPQNEDKSGILTSREARECI